MDRLDTLLSRFHAEYLELHGVTEQRRREQLALLRRLAAGLDHPLDELSARDVQEFIGANLGAGVHPNTGRKQLGMIRSFVTWASEADIFDETRTNQLRLVRNPRGSSSRSAPKPYKVSEIRSLYAALAEKYPVLPEYGRGSRALMRFMHGTSHPKLRRHLWRHARRLQFEAQLALALELGLRRIEIHRLTLPAMHPDNDQVLVFTAKQGPGSDARRAVPYTTHARTCVQDWLDFRALVLHPPHEHPWLTLDFHSSLDVQVAAMPITRYNGALHVLGARWRWHRLRHTAATEWLRAGVPLEKVSIYMGHSSLEQTLAYTKILNSDVDDAFGAAEEAFAKRLGLAA